MPHIQDSSYNTAYCCNVRMTVGIPIIDSNNNVTCTSNRGDWNLVHFWNAQTYKGPRQYFRVDNTAGAIFAGREWERGLVKIDIPVFQSDTNIECGTFTGVLKGNRKIYFVRVSGNRAYLSFANPWSLVSLHGPQLIPEGDGGNGGEYGGNYGSYPSDFVHLAILRATSYSAFFSSAR
jgi:hypothetical protein